MAAGTVADLPDAYIGMIDRQVAALGESDAEQAPGGIEGSLHHIVEDEVRLYFGLVEVVLGLPDLLGVVAPIPRLDRCVQPLGTGGLLEICQFRARFCLGWSPDLQ